MDRDSLASVVGTSASTETAISSAAVGPIGIALSTAQTGKPVFGAGATPQVVVPGFHVLVTRDGTTWSNQALTQLAGQSAQGVNGILVTNNRFLVTVVQTTQGHGPTSQVVLVGTAR